MAKVRRINVSQIEGGYSNDGDKRPNGEVAFYDDDDGGFDMVMHNGVDSTDLNKVLGKGKLYGHGADSGDGLGYDTIKLIPDIPLFNSNSNQYIVVDPTAPNHIHLRAGGNMDASTAELFLGGENNHFRTADYGSATIKVTNPSNSSEYSQWNFNYDKTVSIPNGSVITTSYAGLAINSTVDAPSPSIGDLLTGSLYVSSGQISISYTELTVGGQDTRFQWDFSSTTGELQLASGGLKFSDQSTQTTAWTGGRVVTPPASSVGADGDQAGDIAFDSGYIYYCTAAYGQIGHQVTVATLHDGNTTINTNLLQLTQTPETLQIQVGDIIADSDGGATSVVGLVSSDGTYTYVGTGPGGSIAYNCVFPLTFTSPDYVPGGNIWKRVALSSSSW